MIVFILKILRGHSFLIIKFCEQVVWEKVLWINPQGLASKNFSINLLLCSHPPNYLLKNRN